MSATKSSSPNSMQRVAKHLSRRGQSYTFRRGIPVDARPAFGGIREILRSLGDVTESRAKALGAVHNEFCSLRIDEARGKRHQSKKPLDFMRVTRVPELDEIERAVRAWLVELEAASSAFVSRNRREAEEQIRAMRYLDAEVMRVM